MKKISFFVVVGELCYKLPCSWAIGWRIVVLETFFSLAVESGNENDELGVRDCCFGGGFPSLHISSFVFFLPPIVFLEVVFLLTIGYVKLPLGNLVLASLKLLSYGRIEFHYLHSFTLTILERKFIVLEGKASFRIFVWVDSYPKF